VPAVRSEGLAADDRFPCPPLLLFYVPSGNREANRGTGACERLRDRLAVQASSKAEHRRELVKTPVNDLLT
jgi:hypothetical protein